MVTQWGEHNEMFAMMIQSVYIRESISRNCNTAVSILRCPVCLPTGKADKTFNMFKLASISIVLYSTFVHDRVSMCTSILWCSILFIYEIYRNVSCTYVRECVWKYS